MGLVSQACDLWRHPGPRVLKGPVLCLMFCCCCLEIVDNFTFVNKVRWNLGASARGLEPWLTHGPAFFTSLGQVLRHLLPSRLVPQDEPGLALTPSLPHAQDSSWVAGRVGGGREA